MYIISMLLMPKQPIQFNAKTLPTPEKMPYNTPLFIHEDEDADDDEYVPYRLLSAAQEQMIDHATLRNAYIFPQ